MGKTIVNGVIRDMTAEEQSFFDARQKEFADDKPNRQIKQIRDLRNEKLNETDYLALSDNTLSDNMKAFRKTMRDIPQDYSADKYDELLATDEQGNLTHSVWSKP